MADNDQVDQKQINIDAEIYDKIAEVASKYNMNIDDYVGEVLAATAGHELSDING